MCSLLISPPSLFNKVPSDSWTTGNLARTSLTVAGAAHQCTCTWVLHWCCGLAASIVGKWYTLPPLVLIYDMKFVIHAL